MEIMTEINEDSKIANENNYITITITIKIKVIVNE